MLQPDVKNNMDVTVNWMEPQQSHKYEGAVDCRRKTQFKYIKKVYNKNLRL